MSAMERSGLHWGGRWGKYSQHGDTVPFTPKYMFVDGALHWLARKGVSRESCHWWTARRHLLALGRSSSIGFAGDRRPSVNAVWHTDPVERPPTICALPWQNLSLDVDGSSRPCCKFAHHDDASPYQMANLKDAPL